MENRLDSRSPDAPRPGKRRHRRKTPPAQLAPASPVEQAEPGRDYTPEILEFLANVHGGVRLDSAGDYYYERVSTISLHFLLQSPLPAKEVLWRWYRHFEYERAESIYQTLPPLRDEEFLQILATCDFRWDEEEVRASGLVFLEQHRAEVYTALEEIFTMRLEAFETMNDSELADVLRSSDTWSDRHLAKLIRVIQIQSLREDQRQFIYDQLDSDYLKATARHLIDEALSENFWKSPPLEMEGLHSRFIIFARTMTNTARRLGVYVARGDFDSRVQYGAGQSGARRGRRAPANNHRAAQDYFATLGLEPSAKLTEVKLAYREMVKRHHPDQGGSVQDFLHLQEAYEYLLTRVF